jgi:hypothetical protein
MKPPAKKPPAKAAPAKAPGALQRLVNALFVAEKSPKTAPVMGQKAADPRAELARMIRTIRARLDPKVVKLAEKIARKGPPTTDQERAMLSVELFLAQRDDGGAFAAKLRAKLEKERGGPTKH